MKSEATLTSPTGKLKVVLVSKGKSVPEIKKVLSSTGFNLVGENRVEEAEEKFLELPSNLEKHFLGKLQKRKLKKIAELFDVIQTVESKEDLKRLESLKKPIRIFIQVNLSNFANRQGVPLLQADALIKAAIKSPTLQLEGVMGMASKLENAREEFQALKALQVKHGLKECSMGMSEDHKIAIQEGATMIRLGRMLFES